jgi:hypothetical protein
MQGLLPNFCAVRRGGRAKKFLSADNLAECLLITRHGFWASNLQNPENKTGLLKACILQAG